ncbi:uncharacterized protein [Antedon mediterranea]|uniref:uncharacterized protein n=1 Tax=Antedon mediterranea TaxID=105859 RepID=UPI003AF728FB
MNQKWYRGGYLFVKQSAKDRKRGLKPWRRKFVAVHQNACTSGVSLLFELYQDEFTYRQVACVLLNDITSVKRCTSRTNKHAFAVLSPRRQLYLAADSETDALEWIAMLRKFMVKKAATRDPIPHESEDDGVFNISILPNEHSERLELYENYRMTVNSPYLCLHNSRRIVLQWKLINLKRFMLTKKCHEKDRDKILYISTNSRCKNGECEIVMYCNRGKQIIPKLLEEVSRNRHARISRRRSITSSMIFDITPEDLARLGTISESSSDDDSSKKGSESSKDIDTPGRDVRPKYSPDGVMLRQNRQTLQKSMNRQWRTPTVGKPMIKKRRAPAQAPPSPSSSSSSDKRSLEYCPSIASSSSTVTSDFDFSSIPEDDIASLSDRSQCGTLKATGTNDSSVKSSSPPTEQRAYKGTAPITPKPIPPRPKHPPKLSPLLQAKYITGSVEKLSSNKENRANSPPMSPKSTLSANSSFSSIDISTSPPIPPRRRKQKHATLERCTNIHTDLQKQSESKPTLMQIANGEITRKSSTLKSDRTDNKSALSDVTANGHVENYNNNASASSSDDDTASEKARYSDDSGDVMGGNWYYDIRPYISTKKEQIEVKVASVDKTVQTEAQKNDISSQTSKPEKDDKKENFVTTADEYESDVSENSSDMIDVKKQKQISIVQSQKDNKTVSDNKQQVENTTKSDVNIGTSNENKINTIVDKKDELS